jgi:stage V sporulation protein B
METSSIPGGTLRITLANVSQYLIQAVFYVIVTRTNALTSADIGILSILTTLTSTFSLLTLLALPTALTKFTAEKLGTNQREDAAAIQKTITKTVLTLSIAGFAIVTLSAQLLSQYLWNNLDFIILLILNFTYAFLLNIETLFHSKMQALSLFGKMATLTLTYIASSRTIAVVLALLNMGITGVLIGYVVGAILTVILATRFLRGKFPATTKTVPLKPLLQFSLPLVLGAVAALTMTRADIVMITTLTGDYSLTGVYYIALNSVGTLSILYLPMITTIFPTLSAHHGLKDPHAISNILRTTSRYILYIMLPSCIGLAIIAPTALAFFYGADYVGGAAPLAILSIHVMIVALVSLLSTTLTAIGKTGQILRINIVAACTTILTLLALVPFLQTTGAALAHLTTQIVSLALAAYILSKEIKIRLDTEALWKATLATAVTAPVLLVVEQILAASLTITQTLIIELAAAIAVYAVALYLLKALKNQDFELLKQALPARLGKYLSALQRLIVR